MDLGFILNIPPITKVTLGCSAALAIGVSTNLVSEQALVLIPARISEGEAWRLLTSLFFVSPFDVHFFFMWSMYVACSRWLEEVYYPTARGYLWRLLLLAGTVLCASFYFGNRMPSETFLSTIVYLTSRRNPEGANVQWIHFIPWEFNLYNSLVGAAIMQPERVKIVLTAIAVGHSFLVLEDVIPQWTGKRLLALPGEPAPFV